MRIYTFKLSSIFAAYPFYFMISSILFLILVIIRVSFAVMLAFFAKAFKKKGIGYLYIGFFLDALLLLAPALRFSTVDLSFAKYISAPLKVVITPLVYLYLLKIFRKEKNLTLKEYWHFAPFVFELIVTLFINMVHESNPTVSLNEGFKVYIDGNFNFNVLAITARTIALGQGLFYSILLYKLFRKYNAVIRQLASFISSNNFYWIRVAAILVGIKGLSSGVELFGIYSFPIVFFVYFLFLVTFAFYFFGHAISQPDVSFIDKACEEENNATKSAKAIESSLNIHILEIFKEKRLFLNSELTLQQVSDELAITKQEMTQIIKAAGYHNFYDLVNMHRIERSKELLKNLPDHFSLDSVVADSGFNGRSTFYRVFKESTGLTPKEFKEMNYQV